MRVRLATAALFAVALTGCATGGVDSSGATSDQAPVGSNRPSADADAAADAAEARRLAENAAAAASASAEAAKVKVSKFGQTYTWEDNVSVTISEPTPFQPSSSAAADEAAAYLAFDVTVVNGSDDVYETSMFGTSAQSGNTEADEVFDTAQGFDGAPSTKLLPGREATFKIGYGVSTPSDIVMEVSPGFEYQAAIFTS